MGYKMKKFSGFGKSPAKQTQGFGGKQLIKAQKELAEQEHAYRAPGWTRAATSVLSGNDPSGGGGKQKGDDVVEEKKGTGGGLAGAVRDVKSVKPAWEEFFKEFKGSDN